MGTPERTCIVSRETGPADALLRFVLSPEGVVTPDLDGKLPGRGLYLRPEAALLDQAIKRNAFSRAAKTKAEIPQDLSQTIQRLLDRRLGRQIGLARRAGEAIAGFEKVREMLKGGPVALLLTAADAGADGRAKLARLAEAVGSVPNFEVPQDAVTLGGLLGREQAVHVAILPGGLAVEIGRLLAWRAALFAGGSDTVPVA